MRKLPPFPAAVPLCFAGSALGHRIRPVNSAAVSDPVWPKEPVTQWAALLIRWDHGPPVSRCGLGEELWNSGDINHAEAQCTDQKKGSFGGL